MILSPSGPRSLISGTTTAPPRGEEGIPRRNSERAIGSWLTSREGRSDCCSEDTPVSGYATQNSVPMNCSQRESEERGRQGSGAVRGPECSGRRFITSVDWTTLAGGDHEPGLALIVELMQGVSKEDSNVAHLPLAHQGSLKRPPDSGISLPATG